VDIAELIDFFSPGIAKLTAALPEVLRGRELALFEQRRKALLVKGSRTTSRRGSPSCRRADGTGLASRTYYTPFREIRNLLPLQADRTRLAGQDAFRSEGQLCWRPSESARLRP
jgi:hypothetical protein